MVKKFVYSIVAILMVATGCQKEVSDVKGPEVLPQKEIVPSTRIVSPAQAAEFGSLAIGAIEKQEDVTLTKAVSSRVVEDVLPIYNDEGVAVMYAINYADNGGFMLISADKESSSFLIAYNDRGRLDPQTIDPKSPFGMMIDQHKASISAEIESGIHSENEKYQIWDALDSEEGYTVSIELVNAAAVPGTKGTHRNSYGYDDVDVSSVVYNYLWGQGRGYNADAPHPGVDLTGCPSVAIGLLCLHHRYPSQFDYNNMTTTVTTRSSNAVSRMMRTIGNNIPGYEWSAEGSGALADDIVTGLKRLGYKGARLANYSFSRAYNDIAAGRPVLLGGFSYEGGHIWIGDGYWEQIWKVSRGYYGSNNYYYVYQDNIYMNWGWDGEDNGWIDQASWPYFGSSRQIWYNLYPGN
ncbi:MAG: C10 family peptidase [Bacteroidota bacterium]|nr:C10 family peptidase [Bacteroidota bacterium]